MTRSRADTYGNIAAFGVVILFNYLANSIPLGGNTTGEISDRYFSMFTPAGFTFAIWGVIYLLLLGFVIRQSLPRTSDRPPLSKIGGPFKLNCLANAGWILAWHFDQLLLSMLLMIVILATLVNIYSTLRSDSSMSGGWDFAFLCLPFGVYLGWISVAAIANLSILQSAYHANDFLISQQTWTLIKLGVAGGAAIYFARKFASAEYTFVIAWAAYGISSSNDGNPIVETAAQILSILAMTLGIAILVKSRWKPGKTLQQAGQPRA